MVTTLWLYHWSLAAPGRLPNASPASSTYPLVTLRLENDFVRFLLDILDKVGISLAHISCRSALSVTGHMAVSAGVHDRIRNSRGTARSVFRCQWNINTTPYRKMDTFNGPCSSPS